MFALTRPTDTEISRQIEAAQGSGPREAILLSLEGWGPVREQASTFAHDRHESVLGVGKDVFASAKRAFIRWEPFHLGWARVANPAARIAIGEIVGVEVHSLGLWSLNLSRIVAMIDTPEQFGFVYSTTALHVEEGEERFLLRFDPVSGEVRYELAAVSRPRYWMARFGYPVTRAFQHRFAWDSHRRMAEVTWNSSVATS
jgi:uncharacterized protein (UPF0548 family)